jgi:hypothetical protein
VMRRREHTYRNYLGPASNLSFSSFLPYPLPQQDPPSPPTKPLHKNHLRPVVSILREETICNSIIDSRERRGYSQIACSKKPPQSYNSFHPIHGSHQFLIHCYCFADHSPSAQIFTTFSARPLRVPFVFFLLFNIVSSCFTRTEASTLSQTIVRERTSGTQS